MQTSNVTSVAGSSPTRRNRIGLAGTLFLAGLTLFMTALTPVARAQTLDIDTVLDNIAESARALEDAGFLLTGKLVNPDGTTITLEIDVLIVPPLSLGSAYIIQPDALADNIIILDGPSVLNYTFLTNQVMIFDADDPDALGGLLPSGDNGATANISFDLSAILSGYVGSISEVKSGPHGETYVIHFVNIDPTAAILDVIAEVPSADWLPRRLVFIQSDGHVLAELNAERLEVNTGLDPDYVRELPDDVEVIDNRR